MTRPTPRRAVVTAMALALAAAGACGGADEGSGAGDRATAGGATVTLRVLAPASLTEAFSVVAEDFEAANANTDVSISFGGSPSLVTQLAQGAPADVIATADDDSMGRALVAGDVTDPVVFARNRLAVIVERGNPQQVRRVQDLARTDLVVVGCAAEVPCGRLAASVLASAGVDVTLRSQEENVKAVLARVRLGEADAGFVYETDATGAAEEVDRLDVLPRNEPLTTPYAIAVTTEAAERDLARRWIAFVRSPAAQRVLADHGFLPA